MMDGRMHTDVDAGTNENGFRRGGGQASTTTVQSAPREEVEQGRHSERKIWFCCMIRELCTRCKSE